MIHDLYSEAIALIERALCATLTADEAGRFLSGLRSDADHIISEAAHAVVHFVTDADIRKRDKEYDILLRAELEKYAERMKSKLSPDGMK
ncbi:MAG: hypothetical protein IDH49_02120 [Gammaproteobacteria bacterium]|nr:hypothetical protein [Gammaproteobacteria bacterium]